MEIEFSHSPRVVSEKRVHEERERERDGKMESKWNLLAEED